MPSKMRRTEALILLLLFQITAAGAAATGNGVEGSIPQAQGGVIDLRGYSLSDLSPLRLDGEWEFYWDKVVTTLNYPDFLNQQPDLFIDVPSYWDDLKKNNPTIEALGVATYKLTILTDESPDKLALKFLNITPNADIFVDGKLAAKNGNVDKNPRLSKSGNRIQIIPVDATGDPLTLVVSVSNFHNVNGGLNRPIYIGGYNPIRADRERRLALDSVFLGGLLLMGLYQLALFLMEPKRRATLFISILCFLAFFFSGFKNEMAILSIFPSWDGEIRTKFIYLALALAPPTFTLYAYNLYPLHLHKGFNWFVVPVSLVFSALILITPKSFYTPFLIPMELVVLVAAIYTVVMLLIGYRKTKAGRILLYLGGLAFLLLSILFSVIDNERTFVFQSVAVTFFIFILYQAYLQAFIFSSAFHQIDDLSKEKSNLEKRNVELFSLTYIDSLTETCNRRLMDDYLASTWRVNALTNRNVGMVLIDIDDFKYYNDFYGRRVGDQCVVRVSELIRDKLSSLGQDALARYGGEEFAVIFSEIDEMTLFRTAEMLREAVESGGIQHPRSRASNVVTISIGCATLMPSMDEDPTSLIDAAAKALYRAKKGGRNRSELYREESEFISGGLRPV